MNPHLAPSVPRSEQSPRWSVPATFLTVVPRPDAPMDESDDAGRLTAAFVTNLNHELRTPLAAIIALTQVLEEELDGSALEFVRMIRSSGDRLNGSIEHMLAEVDEKARAAGS